MRFARLGAALAAMLMLSAQTSLSNAEGQVWEYKTRPQDTGSLLKIQRIEPFGNERVYHLSVIGVHFRNHQFSGILPHIPVAAKTLDESLIRRSKSMAEFPTTAVDEGIKEWRAARGGIYTIPIASILDITDEMLSKPTTPVPAEPTPVS